MPIRALILCSRLLVLLFLLNFSFAKAGNGCGGIENQLEVTDSPALANKVMRTNNLGSNPFAMHYVASCYAIASLNENVVDARYIHYRMDIEVKVRNLEDDGYISLGRSEYVEQGSRMGVSNDAREQAAAIGASIVLFQFTPIKLESIRRLADGSIDIESARTAPSTTPTELGYYLTKAIFFAKKSLTFRGVPEN
ncbi:hypothetical protein [Rugamonas rivuli]|uniref:Uncharacterized protein n=1 Tax=Rugamonas rivuli TaxID=2743358 RepID=A0A843SMF4_9BURK|nr:hypothetical protein [Rugamonas rivuli]MQA23658.1 hypothetical protein [Rugamonas rivuli]